jgi:hypothetical protein
MKTSAEKSSSTSSKTATQAAQPFFTKAGSGSFFAPTIQTKLTINKAGDKFEQEADNMAYKIMRMPSPTPVTTAKEEKLQRQTKKEDDKIQKTAKPEEKIQKKEEDKIQKAPVKEEKLQRKGGNNTPVVTPSIQLSIQNKTSGGQALGSDVRSYMEPRFNADFSKVRVHNDAESASLNNQLSARAFTHQNHIFFSRNQYQPDTSAGKQLLAHELTHTIQQGHAVQRSPQISTTTTPPPIQRLGLGDILDGLAELAANVPGFTLLTLIIGRNPINMRVVERTAVNILRGFMGLIPGGELLFQVLQHYGVMERLGNWLNIQVATLGLSFQTIRDAFTRFTDSLGISDIFSPRSVWERARSIFTPIIDTITRFVSNLITQAITWLKETFMQPLSEFCQEIPGYGLIKVMLGRDPFTNASVPRTAMTVVRAFAEFIPGGTEKVEQLQQSGALERAYNWFTEETQARNLTWTRVTSTFAQVWAMLSLESVLHPIDTLRNLINLFRPLLGDLVSFAGAALLKLLELIYEAAMGAGGRRILDILTRARATFTTIIRNPVGFLSNLLGAVGQGVRQFMTNILTHLRDGVIAWLAGPVARSGIQMPERWDLRGIIWFVLQILGLTWTRVREKLVRLMGERPVALLEQGFQLIQDIRERGLVQALRDRVTEFFGNLREAALGAIRSFIQQRLVMAGITQLLSMLNPVGAVIQAIIKTYTTVQFFIQRINQILDLVESIVNSISAIASGAISAAANFVERTMARTIPVILDFLARFIGLGDVGSQVQNTIRNIQGRVDQMLDRAVEWIRNQARNLASRALGGDPNATPEQRLDRAMEEAGASVNRFAGQRVGAVVLRPLLAAIRLRHRLTRLEVVLDGGRWIIEGEVNPRRRRPTPVLGDGAGSGSFTFTSRVHYYSANGNRGAMRMLADPIGPDFRSHGSRPSEAGAPPIWTQVNIRRSSNGPRLYVLGHLLNHRLGGTGDSPTNLTPISFSMNARHYSSVEQHIVDNIGTAANPRWYRYEVVVNYPSSRRTISSADRAKGVVDAEGLLANSFTCTWQELETDPANATRLRPKAGVTLRNVPVPHDIPPYPDT